MENKNKISTDEAIFEIKEEAIKELKKTPLLNNNTVIGQDRALEALQKGLGIKTRGYNLFVMGCPGTGRKTAILNQLEQLNESTEKLEDVLYVYNFKQPLKPMSIILKSGAGIKFKTELEKIQLDLIDKLSSIEKNETYSLNRKIIIEGSNRHHEKILAEFENEIKEQGFSSITTDDNSLDLYPIIDGNPISFEDLQQKIPNYLENPTWQELRNKYYELLDKLTKVSSALAENQKNTEEKITVIQKEMARPIIEEEFKPLLDEFSPNNSIKNLETFICDMKIDILDHLAFFIKSNISQKKKNSVSRYKVNLFCDNSSLTKVPIVQEELPTFVNLFGTIEASQNGPEVPDTGHLRLRSGAIHKARGGYLILRISEILKEEGAWPYLKQILQTGEMEIQSPPLSSQMASSIKPEKISMKLKVIMLGVEQTYDILYQEDPDFAKLFKICSEFDSSMKRTPEAMRQYIAFITDYTQKFGLLPADDSAIASIIREGSSLSEYRSKLSTKFNLIADLLVDSDYYSRKDGKQNISKNEIQKALARREYLYCLPKEKFLDMVSTDEIILPTTGTSIGAVNGLAVLDRGYYSFGIPVVVTARAAPGSKGLINVEGEAGLSGEIYDKALYIIQGLLRGRYAREIPLMISATICFEQSYSPVDGDSASCAELFSLLSAITEIPLRRDIAITGSINQQGLVQPVGGISEKIEGFFDVCSLKGLSGTQGVIIPKSNLGNLILSQRVENAIKEGKFSIWTISCIDEGVEILSGIPSGNEISPGEFPKNTFNSIVREKLREYSEKINLQNK